MRAIHGHVLIDAPIAAVFDFVADQRNEPRYNPSMAQAQKTTPGPIGVGTQFQATMAGAPHPAAVTITYTKFSRPQSLTSVNRMQGMDIEGTLDFSTEGGQTRLAWSWMLHPRGFLR